MYDRTIDLIESTNLANDMAGTMQSLIATCVAENYFASNPTMLKPMFDVIVSAFNVMQKTQTACVAELEILSTEIERLKQHNAN